MTFGFSVRARWEHGLLNLWYLFRSRCTIRMCPSDALINEKGLLMEALFKL